MAVSGAPSVERELGLSHTSYFAVAFAAPLLAAALLEAGVALASDRIDRRRLVLGGQGVLTAALLFLAWNKSRVGLMLGLSVAGTASGVSCGAAQAILLRADPRGADRVMLRWALFAAIGDSVTPLFTAAALALGFTYRGAMLASAVVVLAQCGALVRVSHHDTLGRQGEDDDEEPAAPLRQALASAARKPRLWAWLLAAASCTLLDEIVVALTTLRMRSEQDVPEALAAAAAVTFAGGAVLGTSVSQRLVGRFGARVVLLASSFLTALALAATCALPSPVAGGVALLVVGVACAPHHALAQARAYAELPRNPGTVQAIGQLFVVIDLVAPLALGAVADHFGLTSALAALMVSPVIIALFSTVLYEAPNAPRSL